MTLKELFEIAEHWNFEILEIKGANEYQLRYDNTRYGRILLTWSKERIHSPHFKPYDAELKKVKKEQFSESLQNYILLIKERKQKRMEKELNEDFR